MSGCPSKCLIKCVDFLQIVGQFKSARTRRTLLRKVAHSKAIFNAMREIAHNYRKGHLNTHLTETDAKLCRRYDKTFRDLCCQKVEKSKKKRAKSIEQFGGVLPYVIPTVASIVAGLAKDAISEGVRAGVKIISRKENQQD